MCLRVFVCGCACLSSEKYVAYTYDGNLCVMCEHHEMKPNVIRNADTNVIANEIIPKKTSRNRPRNVGSSLLMVKQVSLK